MEKVSINRILKVLIFTALSKLFAIIPMGTLSRI
jgi:hypothetical protein